MPKKKSATSKMVHCRFCEYSVPLWIGKKNRKSENGLETLKRHVKADHRKEYKAIKKRSLQEMVRSTPNEQRDAVVA